MPTADVQPTDAPVPTTSATLPPALTETAPVPTLTEDDSSQPSPAWNALAPGIERAYLPTDGPNGLQVLVYALRLDPAQVRFEVLFEEGAAHDITGWQAEADAPLVFNGGFFTGDYRPVGQIIRDGELSGAPLDYGPRSLGVPGMFTVLDNGVVNIYSRGREQFNPRGMDIFQAVESYPLLLLPGGQPTFNRETGRYARRTVIGIDEEGYVIVLLADQPVFTLHQLANWLAVSSLELDTALNLDGGRSSGLAIRTPAESLDIPAYVDLPGVIAVYTR